MLTLRTFSPVTLVSYYYYRIAGGSYQVIIVFQFVYKMVNAAEYFTFALRKQAIVRLHSFLEVNIFAIARKGKSVYNVSTHQRYAI